MLHTKEFFTEVLLTIKKFRDSRNQWNKLDELSPGNTLQCNAATTTEVVWKQQEQLLIVVDSNNKEEMSAKCQKRLVTCWK